MSKEEKEKGLVLHYLGVPNLLRSIKLYPS